MGGGLTGKMIASLICDSAPNARPTMEVTDWSASLRSSHGMKGVNARPAFWPLPEKLKPRTATMWATFFSFM